MLITHSYPILSDDMVNRIYMHTVSFATMVNNLITIDPNTSTTTEAKFLTPPPAPPSLFLGAIPLKSMLWGVDLK